MMNKHRVALILAAACIILNGCGNTTGQDNRIIKFFNKDEYTVKSVLDINDSETTDKTKTDTKNNISNNSEGEYNNTLSEVTLTGEDKSTAFTVKDKTDVVYKGTTYKNLYTNVKSLETKYDINTLINFIVKKYSPESNLVYTVVYKDTVSKDDGDIESGTLDSMLSDSNKYAATKEKYGESVTWMLQFIDSSTRHEVQMYGCDSYIMITSDGYSKEIDMNELDSSNNKETNK